MTQLLDVRNPLHWSQHQPSKGTVRGWTGNHECPNGTFKDTVTWEYEYILSSYGILHYHVRDLHCFSDPLIAWTFYCSSDSLSTELQGHCITRELSTHSPLSVYHLLYSILIPQHPVPLPSMRPNRPRQFPQYPRASSVTPFSPHLKDCRLYSRKLFCFSIFFCRSVTHRSPDLPVFHV
jgi:hypothetical protein